MTVKELIAHLSTVDENLEVAYRIYSDTRLLEWNENLRRPFYDSGDAPYIGTLFNRGPGESLLEVSALTPRERMQEYPTDRLREYLVFPGN